MKRRGYLIDPADSCLIALEDCEAGDLLTCGSESLQLAEAVPSGHKAARRTIAAGGDVIKYGHVIGHARTEIPEGSWIHTHNLTTGLTGTLEYSWQPAAAGTAGADETAGAPAGFQGFVRKDGRVGIRNEIWILPMVGCTNGTARRLAAVAEAEFGPGNSLEGYGGTFAYPHNCGCSELGDDLKKTQLILAGLAKNPNAGGVLLLGLGCENNTAESFLPLLGAVDEERVRLLIIQKTEDEYEEGMKILRQLHELTEQDRRRSVPLSSLVFGLKCGGSDGFSGITANPLCGQVSDRLIRGGAAGLLTEVPEMFGAEELLMARAVDRKVWQDTAELVNGFKSYFLRYGQEVSGNPSPGNKKGGITTLEEKSLGCVQKGGHAPVKGVIHYGEQPAAGGGLFLVEGPGNDMVSVTNLTAAGAVLILFTTGRGNPCGAPVPTMKIATNSGLAGHKPHWIDFNAGILLEGCGREKAADELLKKLPEILEGRAQAKNEQNGFRDISIFRDGVTL